MKLISTGDWQCGQTGALTLEDQEAVWHRIVDVALERHVDLFLHAGDLVHGPIFTMEQLAAIRRVFARLRAAKIPVAIVTGNSVHDLAVRPVHALDVFKDYDGIYVSDRPDCLNFDGLDVCTLPWVSPARLLAMSNGEVNHEKAASAMTPMLVNIAERLYLISRRETPVVLLAHWFIDNTSLPTGLPVDQMHEPVLPWADLDAIGYDAIIAGHNHHGQQISQPLIDSTLGIVVGSPQPLNHGEAGYEHGCWIVDVPALAEPVARVGSSSGAPTSAGERAVTQRGPVPGSASAEFVPIESKRFVTLDLDPEDLGGDAYNLHGADGLEPVLEGDIIRVRYRGTESQAQFIDHESLRRSVMSAGASRVTIEPQIIRKERARAEHISEQLSPVDALAAYCDANDVDPDRALAMLARLKEWSE